MAVPDHAASNERFGTEVDTERLDTRAPLETMPNGSFTSSNVHSGLYDFGESTLFLRFKRDGEPDAIYQYWDVPPSEWDALKTAPSKGSRVNSSIAYDYVYAKFGRGDFPDRHALGNDLLKRFVYDP